jgi:hypothetical protein
MVFFHLVSPFFLKFFYLFFGKAYFFLEIAMLLGEIVELRFAVPEFSFKNKNLTTHFSVDFYDLTALLLFLG